MKRVFLGDHQPALMSTVEYLDETYGNEGELNLASVVVATNSAVANRRLIDHLANYCDTNELRLTAPEIITLGRLPERLYESKKPFASVLLQQLAWTQVLKESTPDDLAPIFPDPPTDPLDPRWMDLGELVRRQHVELAADGYDFKHLAEEGEQTDEFFETDRWRALEKLQAAYHKLLDSLEYWDAQTARLVALERDECFTDSDIILLATVDMNTTLRTMLKQVEAKVTSLVFAPQEWSDRFDALGCLRAEAWELVHINLNDDDLLRTAKFQDQTDETLHAIAGFEGKYSADEITIVATDDAVSPWMLKELTDAGLPVRYGPGKPISESPPYQLIDAVAAYIDSQAYYELAALVRHADVTDWLSGQVEGDWISALDEYFNAVFTDRFPFGFASELEGTIHQIDAAISKWLKPLTGPPRPVADWTETLLECVQKVYEDRELSREVADDRAIIAATKSIAAVLFEMGDLPAALAPQVSASQAIELLLEQIAADRVGEPHSGAAIEIIGWLDTLLDDAPVAIVTGVNEGFLPSSVGSDLFLPNALRSRIGLDDNARRYARDAYAVSMLAAVREELRMIIPRRNADGDPLIPSRILFACPSELAARRAIRFFQPAEADTRAPLAHKQREVAENTLFTIPVPEERTIKRLSPTAFRSYLQCPYRFYLQRVLYLRELTDDVEELDAAGFGTLAHEVVARFGCDPNVRDSQDADEIRQCLREHLNICGKEMFGENPLPSVLVQLQQLAMRLDAFADAQADWAAQGWRIFHVEDDNEKTVTSFDVDGEPFTVHGFIDRIDRNDITGQFAILDYKTSDAAKTPDETHRKKEEWVDLQLPLYRHMARELKVTGEPLMGYIRLPRNLEKVGFAIANWSAADLAAADEVARDVVRKIRQNIFWPPVFPPMYDDEFALICQDNVFDRPKISAE